MERNKDVVRRFFEAHSRHDVEGALALVTEDVVNHHSTLQGREGFREEFAYWYAAFPDASVTVEDLIAEGDRVAIRITGRATHGGEFMGLPATGKGIEAQEIHIARVEDGKIAEIWAAPDLFRVLQQLGALPSEETTEEPVG
jgi:C-1 hydroxylase